MVCQHVPGVGHVTQRQLFTILIFFLILHIHRHSYDIASPSLSTLATQTLTSLSIEFSCRVTCHSTANQLWFC